MKPMKNIFWPPPHPKCNNLQLDGLRKNGKHIYQFLWKWKMCSSFLILPYHILLLEEVQPWYASTCPLDAIKVISLRKQDSKPYIYVLINIVIDCVCYRALALLMHILFFVQKALFFFFLLWNHKKSQYLQLYTYKIYNFPKADGRMTAWDVFFLIPSLCSLLLLEPIK